MPRLNIKPKYEGPKYKSKKEVKKIIKTKKKQNRKSK